MLMQSYGKKGSVADITNQISVILSDDFPSCRNNLMIQFASRHKLVACGVSVKSIRTSVMLCVANGIDILLSYHPSANDPAGHFSVLTGFDKENVYVNDPMLKADEGKDLAIPIKELEELMKPGLDLSEIVMPNTLLLFAPAKSAIPCVNLPPVDDGSPAVPVFSCIIDQVQAYIDPTPEDGRWVFWDSSR